MKSEQQNTQSGRQHEDANGNQNSNKQDQGANKQSSPANSGMTQSQEPQKSNISVGNDGKIGKAHDLWGNNNNGKESDQQYDQNQRKNSQTQGNNQPGQQRSDGDKTDPEINSPDAGTSQKTPQVESNKNSK